VTGAALQDQAGRLAAFSLWLARERELRGLTREAVQRATRLPPAALDALEAGDPTRMPPRAYVLGYLRAYAGAVGLDPDEVALRYEEAVDAGEERVERPGRRLGLRFAAAVLVALAVGWALWAWWRG